MNYSKNSNSSNHPEIPDSWEIDSMTFRINEHLGVKLFECNQDLPNGICLTKGDARELIKALSVFVGDAGGERE